MKRIIFSTALLALALMGCKKEEVEPTTKIVYRTPPDESKAHKMYTEIVNSYQNIFSPHLISESGYSQSIPQWDVMFNNTIQDGEIVYLNYYPETTKVVFMFDTANYQVDSLNVSLIYLHSNSGKFTIQR